ncbi:TonB-dependent receptor domain-containing protein [Arenibaculum pallidiluteum]|uniref:TonB-dependent receptor domain-containing protein n=1 Tax=Arenibaculum pallidiluteum TaxID=2812559 RepID=UPI001A967A71|nr:TonB-dependent receptor [Arenibaculum pallidiluteum]
MEIERISLRNRRRPRLGFRGLVLAGAALVGLGTAGDARAGAPPKRIGSGGAEPSGFAQLQLAQAQPIQARAIELAIPAQQLDTALTVFADQANLRLLFPSEDVAGRRTQGLFGTHTPEQGLALLLAGTGFHHRFVETGTVTIERTVTSQDPGVLQLAPVTILGTRTAGVPLSNVPGSVTVVEREEIRREQATTERIEDILSRRIPGFNPTNNGVRQIRGRTAQVFINGVPVNEQLRASSGSDLNLISPDQLAGVEVSRGANSAYGFGSPGGIIALQTPRAESEELTLRTTVRESLNPHRVGGSHQASLYQSASQILGRFDYHVGGRIAYDGLEFDPDGDRALGFNNTALLSNGKEIPANLDGSFGLDLGESGRLRLTGTYGYVDFTERYAIEPGIYRGSYGSLALDPEGDQSFRRSRTLNLTYENDDIAESALKLEVFTSKTYTEVHSTSEGTHFRDEQTNEYYGLRSAVTTPLAFMTDGSAVSYGLDILRNRYFRPNFNADTGTISTFFSPDVTLDSYAPYAQLEVPVGDFRLSGGIRHEEYRGHVETAQGSGGITGGDIRDFGLTLYNAGVVYGLNETMELYTTLSQGAEITQLGRAARGARSAELIDPQPAKSNQYEFGLRGDGTDLRWGIAAFYTESDLLSALQCDGINPCTPLREPREFWGLEGNADWRSDEQWSVGGVLTWQDGVRETSTGDKRRIGSRDVSPLLLTAYADYSPYAWWRNRLQVSYRGTRDPFGVSTAFDEGRVDDLLLVNVSAGFDIGPGELQVGVRNLFNTEYTSIQAEAGNNEFLWLPEQGMRVFASYSVKW